MREICRKLSQNCLLFLYKKRHLWLWLIIVLILAISSLFVPFSPSGVYQIQEFQALHDGSLVICVVTPGNAVYLFWYDYQWYGHSHSIGGQWQALSGGKYLFKFDDGSEYEVKSYWWGLIWNMNDLTGETKKIYSLRNWLTSNTSNGYSNDASDDAPRVRNPALTHECVTVFNLIRRRNLPAELAEREERAWNAMMEAKAAKEETK